MPDLSDKQLRNLFHAAGHSAPAADLTARILARTAVTPIARRVKDEPLIGRWGWAGIAGLVVALLIVARLAGGEAQAAAPGAPSGFTAFLQHLQLPAGQWPLWAIGGSACAFLLVMLDRALQRRAA